MISKNSVKNGYLKSRNLSEEKTLPEHKFSVTFVLKVGTIRQNQTLIKKTKVSP